MSSVCWQDIRAAIREELQRGTPPLELAETLQLEKYQDVPFYQQYFSQNVQAILFDQLLGPIGWRPQRFYPGSHPQSSHLNQDLPTYQPSQDTRQESSEETSQESSEEEMVAGFGGGDWTPIIIN